MNKNMMIVLGLFTGIGFVDVSAMPPLTIRYALFKPHEEQTINFQNKSDNDFAFKYVVGTYQSYHGSGNAYNTDLAHYMSPPTPNSSPRIPDNLLKPVTLKANETNGITMVSNGKTFTISTTVYNAKRHKNKNVTKTYKFSDFNFIDTYSIDTRGATINVRDASGNLIKPQ